MKQCRTCTHFRPHNQIYGLCACPVPDADRSPEIRDWIAADRGTQCPAWRQKEPFNLGDLVRKVSGSSWSGRVVGYYSTTLTPVGVAVESEHHPGSVQIYPAHALEQET